VAGDAGDHDDAAVLRAVGDHLPCGVLRREVGAHDVGCEQAPVLLGRELEEGHVPVDAGAGDADIQRVVEVPAEPGEAILEGFGVADVHAGRTQFSCMSMAKKTWCFYTYTTHW